MTIYMELEVHPNDHRKNSKEDLVWVFETDDPDQDKVKFFFPGVKDKTFYIRKTDVIALSNALMYDGGGEWGPAETLVETRMRGSSGHLRREAA